MSTKSRKDFSSLELYGEYICDVWIEQNLENDDLFPRKWKNIEEEDLRNRVETLLHNVCGKSDFLSLDLVSHLSLNRRVAEILVEKGLLFDKLIKPVLKPDQVDEVLKKRVIHRLCEEFVFYPSTKTKILENEEETVKSILSEAFYSEKCSSNLLTEYFHFILTFCSPESSEEVISFEKDVQKLLTKILPDQAALNLSNFIDSRLLPLIDQLEEPHDLKIFVRMCEILPRSLFGRKGLLKTERLLLSLQSLMNPTEEKYVLLTKNPQFVESFCRLLNVLCGLYGSVKFVYETLGKGLILWLCKKLDGTICVPSVLTSLRTISRHLTDEKHLKEFLGTMYPLIEKLFSFSDDILGTYESKALYFEFLEGFMKTNKSKEILFPPKRMIKKKGGKEVGPPFETWLAETFMGLPILEESRIVERVPYDEELDGGQPEKEEEEEKEEVEGEEEEKEEEKEEEMDEERKKQSEERFKKLEEAMKREGKKYGLDKLDDEEEEQKPGVHIEYVDLISKESQIKLDVKQSEAIKEKKKLEKLEQELIFRPNSEKITDVHLIRTIRSLLVLLSSDKNRMLQIFFGKKCVEPMFVLFFRLERNEQILIMNLVNYFMRQFNKEASQFFDSQQRYNEFTDFLFRMSNFKAKPEAANEYMTCLRVFSKLFRGTRGVVYGEEKEDDSDDDDEKKKKKKKKEEEKKKKKKEANPWEDGRKEVRPPKPYPGKGPFEYLDKNREIKTKIITTQRGHKIRCVEDLLGRENKEGAEMCTKCNNQVATKRCARCKNAFYCSRDCQIQDWGKHKSNCAKKE